MFVVDQRIEKDSILVTELELCQVRLQNDKRFPWLVLLPKVSALIEVHELTDAQQSQLMLESSKVAKVLKKITSCKKVNVANLGNVVSQLHWHVVARFENDDAWPGPIWGIGTAQSYSKEEQDKFVSRLLAELEKS